MIKKIKENSLIRFVIKLAAFFVVVFILDRAIGSTLKNYYFKQKSGNDFETTYAIEKTTANIVVFGSSRAVNIFDPSIFTNRFNLSCYNAGRYGEPIFYHYALLKSVLKRYKPKLIILSFDAGNFSNSAEAYDRLSVLLPYYQSHPELRTIAALKSQYEKLKLLSHTYPYNSLILPIITGNRVAASESKYSNLNGFIAIKKIFKGPLKTFDYTIEKELDSVKINAYKSFLQDCIDANIKLYVICPPYMINPVGADHSIILAKEIAQKMNIQFLDYSRDSFFISKPELFADFRHLNETGVVIFTNNVIDSISGKKF